MEKKTSFIIDDPVTNPMVFLPENSEANWGTDPLPPPRPKYKRNIDDIGDDENVVTSDWNFVMPN